MEGGVNDEGGEHTVKGKNSSRGKDRIRGGNRSGSKRGSKQGSINSSKISTINSSKISTINSSKNSSKSSSAESSKISKNSSKNSIVGNSKNSSISNSKTSSTNSSLNKMDVKSSSDSRAPSCNSGDFCDPRNEFHMQNTDQENCGKSQKDNIKFTQVNNSHSNYDNQAVRQSYDAITSNELSANKANMCFSNNSAMNYHPSMRDGNNNLIKPNNVGYLDYNILNSNHVYNMNKVYIDGNPFAIKTSTTDNNLLNMSSDYFNNAMKCYDYHNCSNLTYHTGMLNTSTSENQKNYSNNSSPHKSDYLKYNLYSVNSIHNNLNFSNVSNSNNVNSNVTTPASDAMNYNPISNSCNVKYTPNILDSTPVRNINFSKAKDLHFIHSNKAFLQDSDLSNHSYRKLKNENLSPNCCTPVCNVISIVDPSRYISNNRSKHPNKDLLKTNALSSTDSSVAKEDVNAFVSAELGIAGNHRAKLQTRGTESCEEVVSQESAERTKRGYKHERGETRKKDAGMGEDKQSDKKKENTYILKNDSNTQNKKRKSSGNSSNADFTCGKPRGKSSDQDRERCNTNEQKKDLKEENFAVTITKNQKSRRSVTNENQQLKNEEQNYNCKKDTHECSYKKGAREIPSKGSSKNQIVVHKRNSQVLTKIMNFHGSDEDIKNDSISHKKKSNIEHTKGDELPDIVKSSTIKDRLRSRSSKEQAEKNKALQDSTNGKNLSKYDFLMNRNTVFNNVPRENKKEEKKKVTSPNFFEEKCTNSKLVQNDNTVEKKRKLEDISQGKADSKGEPVSDVVSKNEKKLKTLKTLKTNEDPKDEKNARVLSSAVSTKGNSQKDKGKEKARQDQTHVSNASTGGNKNCAKAKNGDVVKGENLAGKKQNEKINETGALKVESRKKDDRKAEQGKTSEKVKEAKRAIQVQNGEHLLAVQTTLLHKMKEKNSIEETDTKEPSEVTVETEEVATGESNLDKGDKKEASLQGKFSQKQTKNPLEGKNSIRENGRERCSNEDGNAERGFSQMKLRQRETSKAKGINKEVAKPAIHAICEKKKTSQMNNPIRGKCEAVAKEEGVMLGSTQADASVDAVDGYKKKEDIVRKEQPKGHKRCSKQNGPMDEEKKGGIRNITELKPNICNAHPAKEAAEKLETPNIANKDVNKKLNDEKINIMGPNGKVLDKDKYKITDSVIYPNDTKIVQVKLKKKKSVKVLAQDLQSETNEKSDSVHEKTNKIWPNLGYINYVGNLVGNGSFGHVRKALYNIEDNIKDLKFYIDKVKSPEFAHLLKEYSTLNNLEHDDEKDEAEANPDATYSSNACSLKRRRPNSLSLNDGSPPVSDQKKVNRGIQNDITNFQMNKRKESRNIQEPILEEHEKENQCPCCDLKGNVPLAIKEIDVNRKGMDYQFLREQEMMGHFNSNVIKPISTKNGNLEERRNYEILMHCAHGDLKRLLQNLLIHRKKEFEKRKKINKILKLIHIIFGEKYKCYKNENKGEYTCIGLCYQKLKNVKMKLNNIIVEVELPTLDLIYDSINAYNCGLTELECKFLFFQIANGISFLQTCHQSNIIRLTDVKLQNILVFTNDQNIFNPFKWHLCISDFGCSVMEYATYHLENLRGCTEQYKIDVRQWKQELINQLSSFFQGTVYTMAPEGLCYDHKGNFRHSQYNPLMYFYEQNFGNIDDRFAELQKSVTGALGNVGKEKGLNKNSRTNFYCSAKENTQDKQNAPQGNPDGSNNAKVNTQDKQNIPLGNPDGANNAKVNTQDKQNIPQGNPDGSNNANGEMEKEKNAPSEKDPSQKKELPSEKGNTEQAGNEKCKGKDHSNVKDQEKDKMKDQSNDQGKAKGQSEVQSKKGQNESKKKMNNTSTEYFPFDARCDSWALGIILADLGKCGMGSYDYIASENFRASYINCLANSKNVDLNSIVMNDLNFSEGEEVFYLQCIMHYYDITSLEWGDECLENEELKMRERKGDEPKSGSTTEERGANNGGNAPNKAENKAANKEANKAVNNAVGNLENRPRDNAIAQDMYQGTDKPRGKRHRDHRCSPGRSNSSKHHSKRAKGMEIKLEDNVNDFSKQSKGNLAFRRNDPRNEPRNDEEKNHIEGNNSEQGKKNKTDDDDDSEDLELFTDLYREFVLKYKDLVKEDKLPYLKQEFVNYFKDNKYMITGKNIEKKILFLFLIINNNLMYSDDNEYHSFLKTDIAIRNIGSGIFKFRDKGEKEKYLVDFRANLHKEHMNGNKDYWHSRLTNKYLAYILKEICHKNFCDRKKNIKRCFSRFEYPLYYSNDYWNLLTLLLNYVPYERLLSSEVLGHDFFSNPSEKIKHIVATADDDSLDLFSQKELLYVIRKNYVQEKKENKYVCNPFLRKNEDKTATEESESNMGDKSLQLRSNKGISSNCVTKSVERRVSAGREKERNLSKMSCTVGSEKNANQQKKHMTSLHNIITEHMKNRCDFCDKVKDCLNYRNVLEKINKLENSLLTVNQRDQRDVSRTWGTNAPVRSTQNWRQRSICNNVYYFLNEASIFAQLTKLDIFMKEHLPFEHLYLPMCNEKTNKDKLQVNFFFKPMYFYSLPYKIIHAWYTGPLHIYLNHPGIPDYINSICLRESHTLRRKEIHFWNCENIVMQSALKLKRLLNCSDDFLCTPYVSHIIGKHLLIKKQLLLKDLHKKEENA
ncbi:Protein kinase domain containing protein [Plasmodium coatneyi]|uniref:Protein kinase domain containing protein n=1 Tax=Plasmodium coatneyi TaxID=208452 RepID=A0A1B1DU75_9APIC|nr:Protein kinase domain containing protein [Plasmodium coatneyi]ANQ06199.1 Protein kinase domain containing protein [Plasmodium coatneyi]